jgi:hypothetical protein
MSAPAVPPPVRARRAPVLEPPYDDEAGAPAQPLTQPGRGPRTQRPTTPRPPRGPVLTGASHDPDGGRAPAARPAPALASAPSPAPALVPVPAPMPVPVPRGQAASRPAPYSPAQAAAQRFVGVCVEILNGHRPASHLRAVVASTELHLVADQLVRRTTRVYLGRPGATSPRPQRVRLRALHVSEPRDGVAEVVAVLEYGANHWAMSARLERRSDNWLCVLVQVL